MSANVSLTYEELREIRRGLALRSQEVEIYDDDTEKLYDMINNLYDKIEKLESELEEVK